MNRCERVHVCEEARPIHVCGEVHVCVSQKLTWGDYVCAELSGEN